MLAVKFYSTMPTEDENILKGISGNIPAIVIDTENFPSEVIDETFVQMTQENYENYLISIQNDLNEWRTIQEQNN